MGGLGVYDFLNLKLKGLAASLRHEEANHLNVGIETGWQKLQKYYRLTDQSPIYRAAIVLHPGSKELYFKEKWMDHNDWIKAIKKAVKGLYQKYADDAAAASREAGAATETVEAK